MPSFRADLGPGKLSSETDMGHQSVSLCKKVGCLSGWEVGRGLETLDKEAEKYRLLGPKTVLRRPKAES